MRRVLLAYLAVWLLIAAGLVGPVTVQDTGPRLRTDGENPQPTAGYYRAFRDEFNDSSNVSASAGVEFTGADVRLPVPAPIHRGRVLAAAPASAIGPLSIMKEGALYKMWHSSCGACDIAYATSADGQAWTKQGTVLSASPPLEGSLSYGDVIKVGTEYRMYYSGSDGSTFRIFAANSTDGVSWNRLGLVLNLGLSGADDDRMVFGPTVVYRSGEYWMWYSASSNAAPNGWVILAANSTDGLTWSRQGVVLRPGPSGDLDDGRVWEPFVRYVGGRYVMIYTGYGGGFEQLFLAESVDGLAWVKLGLIVDAVGPDESPYLQQGTLWIEADGTWSIYYAGRGSQFDIFLSTPASANRSGWVRSLPVAVPNGVDWGWFNVTASIPPESWLNVTVRDAMTLSPVVGYENLTGPTVNLGTIDPVVHPNLTFEAYLTGHNGSSPILDAWEVSWLDGQPPLFQGIESATDLGTGGAVRLAWSAASDANGPITYAVYQAKGLAPFDLAAENYSTLATTLDVSGLINGLVYRFAVRATDGWGNRDGNAEERSVIPTTPVDGTPPTFAGLAQAADAGTGGTVTLNWLAAIDPDTPASNSDPSNPVEYLVFAAPASGAFDFGSPVTTTSGLTADVTGLVDGDEYQFVVRARDAVGNLETNLVIRRAVPTHPYDDTPPEFLGVEDATDLGVGDRANISWNPATDPDTPGSGVDPSLPISYSVYVSTTSSGLGSGTPNATTRATSAVVSGLVPGRTYYVLVRATDAAGNTESNTRIVSFGVAPPPAQPLFPYWWILVILGVAIALALIVVLWRRRKKRQEPGKPE